MTSASELFYTRRSRLGRNTTDLGLDSSLHRSIHHNHNRRHQNNDTRPPHRRDLDDCNPLRQSPHVRHICHRVPYSEHESVRLEQGTSQFGSGNSIYAETLSSITNRPRFTRNERLPGSGITNRPRSTANERLPGAVLLARERLVERLRGVSLSGNSQSSRASSGIYRGEFAFGDDLRLVDLGDWETEISRGWFAGGTPFTDLTSETDQQPFLQEPGKKKPPGLTQEALDCLHLEVFSSTIKGIEGVGSRASWDCSICLESFMEGDKLISLPCGHRFHSACLDPWVRTCGDCPYCRTGIVVTGHRAIKRT